MGTGTTDAAIAEEPHRRGRFRTDVALTFGAKLATLVINFASRSSSRESSVRPVGERSPSRSPSRSCWSNSARWDSQEPTRTSRRVANTQSRTWSRSRFGSRRAQRPFDRSRPSASGALAGRRRRSRLGRVMLALAAIPGVLAGLVLQSLLLARGAWPPTARSRSSRPWDAVAAHPRRPVCSADAGRTLGILGLGAYAGAVVVLLFSATPRPGFEPPRLRLVRALLAYGLRSTSSRCWASW